ASLVKTDSSTQGVWQGAYGNDGQNVINNATSYPSYAKVRISGIVFNSSVWTNSTTDVRALQQVGSTNNIAACWWSATDFAFNVNITDGQTHLLGLYLLDWNAPTGGRKENVQIMDAATGKVLSTQNVSNFQNGEYLVWDVSGNITIKITNLN